MNLMDINNLIDKYEKEEKSLSTIRNLAALYIVRNNICSKDKTVTELSDILPSYLRYAEAKKDYQMGEIQNTQVVEQLKSLCQEICEFIQTLYNTTDAPEERTVIREMCVSIQKMLAFSYKRVV